jgi:predicted nucleotidyltransferase
LPGNDVVRFITIWKVFLPALRGKLMALHDYVDEVVGSKASIRVLKTLVRYRGKIFTIRELARTSGLSHPEVSLVVRDLERRGVVRLQPVGRAHQVILNEENYILKSIVEPLFAAETNTLKAFISTIGPSFKHSRISSVAIFGSVARRLEKRISDIDLLIISNDKDIANECAARATTATLSRFGLVLSPLVMDEDSFRQGRELVGSILESYTMVCGRDLREIVGNGKIGR